jgi:uncharacterized protein YjbI with pentapeptide repeats
MSVREQNDWNIKRKLLIVLAVAGVITIISTLYRASWAGFGADSNKSETIEQVINPKDGKIVELKKTTTNFQSGKTLWDWLGLGGTIAIPIALYQFQRSEQQQVDTNSREEAMLAYFKHISELLIDKELKLLITKKQEDTNFKDPKLNALLDAARACTLSILYRLDQDGERKGRIIRFLSDAGLIGELDLEQANLIGANLNNVKLKGAKLGYAKLSNANLSLTDERIIKKIRKNLEKNLLSEPICADSGVQLYCADLQNANLDRRFLLGVCLESAILKNASLKNTYLTDAILNNADLSGANLTDAILNNANLTGANLTDAILSNADLSGANLTDATLPDGSKYQSPEQIKQFLKAPISA